MPTTGDGHSNHGAAMRAVSLHPVCPTSDDGGIPEMIKTCNDSSRLEAEAAAAVTSSAFINPFLMVKGMENHLPKKGEDCVSLLKMISQEVTGPRVGIHGQMSKLLEAIAKLRLSADFPWRKEIPGKNMATFFDPKIYFIGGDKFVAKVLCKQVDLEIYCFERIHKYA